MLAPALAQRPQAKKLGERKTLYLGITVTIVGLVMYLPFGPGYPKQWCVRGVAAVSAHAGRIPGSDDDFVSGCADSWCATVPSLPFAQMICGMVLGAMLCNYCMSC